VRCLVRLRAVAPDGWLALCAPLIRRPMRRSRSIAFCVASLALLGCGPQQGAQSASRLRLTEMMSDTLPPGFVPSGIAFGREGRMLLWSSQRRLVFIYSRGQYLELPLPHLGAVSAAAFVAGDSMVEVVDPTLGVVWRLLLGAGAVSRVDLQYPHDKTLIAAAYDGMRWQLAYAEPGSIVVGAVTDGGTFAPYAHVPVDATDPVPSVRLTPIGSGILVASDVPPFAPVWLSKTGELRHLRVPAPPPDVEPSQRANEPSPVWVSLPWLSLGDNHLLVTLAELTTDARIMRLVDVGSGRVRDVQLPVVMGFAAADPRRRVLAAVRRTDRVELTQYRWEWEAPAR